MIVVSKMLKFLRNWDVGIIRVLIFSKVSTEIVQIDIRRFYPGVLTWMMTYHISFKIKRLSYVVPQKYTIYKWVTGLPLHFVQNDQIGPIKSILFP